MMGIVRPCLALEAKSRPSMDDLVRGLEVVARARDPAGEGPRGQGAPAGG